MRLGIIADVHANLEALEAVFSDMPPVTSIACAGDVVGYNPWPGECIDRLRERSVVTVSGNHDRAVARNTGFRFNRLAQAGVSLARRQLTDNQLAWLNELPEQRRLCDGRVKIVHGHPDNPDRYTYPDEFASSLLENEDLLVMGHTHVQHVEHFEDGIVLNPGSVGQPRDRDPRAAYATVDIKTMEVRTHRVEYDIDAVQAAVTAADLPDRIGSRLERGE